MPAVLELFAGAGGAAVGLKRAGFVSVGLVEIDKNPCRTLRAAKLGVVFECDVAKVVNLSFVGLLALWASWPCQPFSQAGSGLGALDERNKWPETVAAIDATRPRWFMGENVDGLTYHKKKIRLEDGTTTKCDRRGSHPNVCRGCYFEGVILPDLRKRFAHVSWRLINCADYGLPQTRKRLVVVAGPAPVVWPAPTHAKGGKGGLKRWASMSDALGLPAFTLDGGRNNPRNPKQERPRPSSEPAPTIGTQRNQFVRFVGGGTNPHGKGKGNERTHRDLTEEPAPTICAHFGGGAGNAGPWVEYRLEPDVGKDRVRAARSASEPAPTITSGDRGPRWTLNGEPSPTITTADGQGVGSSKARDKLEAVLGRRRLTPEECAILQGFPVDHPFQPRSLRDFYRQVGNAVPPILAELVGRMVLEAEEKTRAP